MKKLLAVLVVVALAVSMTATAFGADWILYGFEKASNANMWEEHWYTDCSLRHVTTELSTEQVKSEQHSMKITAPAGDEGFSQFGIWCDQTYLKKVTTDMVFDCDIYVPEEGNVSRIVFYLCDDTWEYFAFGSYTVEEWDTWISLSEVYDYLYFQDYADNDGVLPCYFIIECDAVEATEDSYFYIDNFYFGTQDNHKTALGQGEKVDEQWQDPNATATPEPTTAPETPAADDETPANDMMVWYIVGGVVAVAVVAAVVVVVVAKKKK